MSVECEGPHPDPIPAAEFWMYVTRANKTRKVYLCEACSGQVTNPIYRLR